MLCFPPSADLTSFAVSCLLSHFFAAKKVLQKSTGAMIRIVSVIALFLSSLTHMAPDPFPYYNVLHPSKVVPTVGRPCFFVFLFVFKSPCPLYQGGIFYFFLFREKETGVRGRRAVRKRNKARSWARLASPRWFFGRHPFFAIKKRVAKGIAKTRPQTADRREIITTYKE